jgi:Flp pilus assembly protein TadD
MPKINWVASAGGSGAGISANFDPVSAARSREKLNRKWRQRIDELRGEFESHLAAGKLAQQSGDRASAQKHYINSLRLDRYDAAALNLLGMFFFDGGRLVDAESILNAAVANQPENPEWRYNLALVLRASKNDRGAAQALRSLLQMEPGHARATALLAEIDSRGSA